MIPVRLFEFYVDPWHWGLPIAVAKMRGSFSIAILCFHIQITPGAN